MNFIVYTNCQGDHTFRNFVRTKLDIKSYKYLCCYEYFQQQKQLPIQDLKSCDIFIYQIIDKKHGIYNTMDDSGILQYLSQRCKRISFPSIYANIFPIYEEGGMYIGGDIIINLKNKGYDLRAILDMYEKNQLDFNLQSRFQKSLDHMRRREALCCIVLSDFIEQNIRHVRLFDTQNHPNGIVLSYLANKIFEKLDIDYQYDVFRQSHVHIGGDYGYSNYMKKELEICYNEPNRSYTQIIQRLYDGIIKPKEKKDNDW